MSDAALASDNTKSTNKYRPEIDGPRMKVYMSDLRAKNKAGFKDITVSAYRKIIAAQEKGE